MLMFIKDVWSRIKFNIKKQKTEEYMELEKAYEAAIREVCFYKEAINSLPNPIFIKDEGARFLFFNLAYANFFNMKCEEFCGKTVYDLRYLPIEDRLKYQEEDTRMIRESSQVHYEVPFATPDGVVRESLYWSRGFYVEQTGERGLVGEIVDISKEKELQHSLENSMEQLTSANQLISEYARRDSLTGLLNRSVLQGDVPALVERTTKQGSRMSLLVADLDHFKRINDTCGHLYGDELLVSFSLVLKEHCRQGDLAIRYGGEEFLVILPFTSGDQALAVANRICKATNTIVLKKDQGLHTGKDYLTVSIGATQYIAGESIESFLTRGDLAMYQAKERGKDCAVLL
jgi:diguanylate cyclase (GGDEF)-like protein/PAS domain S-box-containing protein